MEEINNLLRFISSYNILGFIPLDKLLHVIFGLIFTISLLRRKISLTKVFLWLAILEGVKEFYDSFVLNSKLIEHVLDFIATFTYPVMILIVRLIKRKNRN